jgi:hypothetical protein
VRLGSAFGVDVGKSDRLRLGFPDVNRFVRFVRLIVRFVVVLRVVSVLVVFVLHVVVVRADLVVMRFVFVRIVFVAVRFEGGAFFLRFGDVLGKRGRFFLGQMLVVMFFGSVRGGSGVRFVVRLIVMLVLVMRFCCAWAFVLFFGRDCIERARSVHSEFVVLISTTSFRDVTFHFIHVRGRRIIDGIRRKVRVRLPLRNRFAGKRLKMRCWAARGRAWSFHARMAETRTGAVAWTTVASVTSAAAIKTARLARLIIARGLVLVFRMRLRFLLRSFGRRRYVKRIVRRFVPRLV